jgi:hypothetical protein
MPKAVKRVFTSGGPEGVEAALKAAKEQADSVRASRARKEKAAGAANAHQKTARGGWTPGSVLSWLFTLGMVGYGLFAAKNIYRIFHPDFPDADASGRAVRKLHNKIDRGMLLRTRVWTGTFAGGRPTRDAAPDWEFDFTYDDATFQTQVQQATSYSLRPRGRCCCFGAPPTQPPTRPHAASLTTVAVFTLAGVGCGAQTKSIPVSLPPGMLPKKKNVHLYVEV